MGGVCVSTLSCRCCATAEHDQQQPPSRSHGSPLSTADDAVAAVATLRIRGGGGGDQQHHHKQQSQSSSAASPSGGGAVPAIFFFDINHSNTSTPTPSKSSAKRWGESAVSIANVNEGLRQQNILASNPLVASSANRLRHFRDVAGVEGGSSTEAPICDEREGDKDIATRGGGVRATAVCSLVGTMVDDEDGCGASAAAAGVEGTCSIHDTAMANHEVHQQHKFSSSTSCSCSSTAVAFEEEDQDTVVAPRESRRAAPAVRRMSFASLAGNGSSLPLLPLHGQFSSSHDESVPADVTSSVTTVADPSLALPPQQSLRSSNTAGTWEQPGSCASSLRYSRRHLSVSSCSRGPHRQSLTPASRESDEREPCRPASAPIEESAFAAMGGGASLQSFESWRAGPINTISGAPSLEAHKARLEQLMKATMALVWQQHHPFVTTNNGAI